MSELIDTLQVRGLTCMWLFNHNWNCRKCNIRWHNFTRVNEPTVLGIAPKI